MCVSSTGQRGRVGIGMHCLRALPFQRIHRAPAAGSHFGTSLFLFFRAQDELRKKYPTAQICRIDGADRVGPLPRTGFPIAKKFRIADHTAPGGLSRTLWQASGPCRPSHNRPVRPLHHDFRTLVFWRLWPHECATGLLIEKKLQFPRNLAGVPRSSPAGEFHSVSRPPRVSPSNWKRQSSSRTRCGSSRQSDTTFTNSPR